jgi:hypothetical protein
MGRHADSVPQVGAAAPVWSGGVGKTLKSQQTQNAAENSCDRPLLFTVASAGFWAYATAANA